MIQITLIKHVLWKHETSRVNLDYSNSTENIKSGNVKKKSNEC